MTLAERLAALLKRAESKIAELRDDTPDDKARSINSEHEAILAEITEVRGLIAAAEADATRANTGIDPEVATRAAAEAADRAVKADRKRAADINTLADKFGERAFAETFVNDGASLDAFRTALIDHLASKEPVVDSTVRNTVGTEDFEKRAAAIENSIMHRADDSIELTEGGRNFRGYSLLEIARENLERAGVKTGGMPKMELAERALNYRQGGNHTTSDFANILGNVANRTLRRGYDAAEQTFRPLVREVSVSDFKTVSSVTLGEASGFQKVNENGEFKYGTISEGAEGYKIATYGEIIGVTRQVIVNDDIGAFTRIPQLLGQAAAQLESDLVWAQILGNFAMADGKALFHADHGNLATAAYLGSASLSAGRTALAMQTGMDGKTVLNIRPRYLIVPVGLETLAEQMLRGVIYPTAPGGVVPESLRSLQIISEPRLDTGINNKAVSKTPIAGSATAFYLSANPGNVDTIELAYLDGNKGVYTETRQGFEIDGVQIKARLDVGAKAVDHRGLLKNPGAAQPS